MPSYKYNIKKFASGYYGVNIDGDNSDPFEKSWITWDFPDANTLHITIAKPEQDPIEYNIPIVDIFIAGENYPDQATVNAALLLLLPKEPGQSETQSGNGIATIFNIAHGLAGVPVYFNVQAASVDAQGIQYVDADETNLMIHYLFAPKSGESNLTYKWTAKL